MGRQRNPTEGLMARQVVRVVLSVELDVDTWAEINGISASDVPGDLRKYFQQLAMYGMLDEAQAVITLKR